MKLLIQEVKPTVIFDYISGDFAGKIFEMMPPKSLYVQAGVLTPDPITFSAKDILFT